MSMSAILIKRKGCVFGCPSGEVPIAAFGEQKLCRPPESEKRWKGVGTNSYCWSFKL